jgi:carbon storage regulator
MLILTRRVGEAILVDGGIRIVVLGLEGGGVRLGIDAPTSVGIVREEIAQRGPGEDGRADGTAIPGKIPPDGQAHGSDG